MPKTRTRSETLNMRIDPQVKFLADIASRETGRSLSGFIEWAIIKALRDGIEDEAIPGAEPRRPAPMHRETLWHKDEAIRFYNFATAVRPLTASEQRLWDAMSLRLLKHEGERTDIQIKRAYTAALRKVTEEGIK